MVIRWVAVTRILSKTTIHECKNNDQFYSQATEAKIYLFPHPFGENEWEIMSLGFIKDIHVVHYPRQLLQEQIVNLIKNQEKSPPTFQLIPQRITTNDKQATTKAYTVQCHKPDASKLIHLLTHGAFREANNQIFVPFKYKTSKPEVFTRCIRQQNDIYYKTWVIKVEGINEEIMSFLKPEISKVMGVMHIVPSKRLDEIGEWKILTEQSKCAYIHRQITNMWTNMLGLVPPQLLAGTPAAFPSPRVSSQRAREYQDSVSDNDSYGSLLTTGTDSSAVLIDDESLNELPAEYKFTSYAAATMASNTTTEETQISSPTTSTYEDWRKEKQELENVLKDQAIQIEKIQADLQEKVTRSKDLEDQLAQALELAHTRDQRHEEMLQKFEMLLQVHEGEHEVEYEMEQFQTTDYSTANDDQELPTTPARKSKPPEFPPAKRPNTNPSPHRFYALFRQQQQRNQIPRYITGNALHIKRKSTPTPLTLPMETEDGDPPLEPEANSGQLME